MDESPVQTVEVDAPERSGVVLIDGGRRVGWSAWGPRDGVPVVLLPGAGTSRALGLRAGVAHRSGTQLVSVDRPGFGSSDPDPDRSLSSVARAVGGLCVALGLDRPAMIGHSQGAPFALAAAATGSARAVALVSPADELAHPTVRRTVPDELGRLVDLCEAEPARAREELAGFDAEGLRSMILASVAARDHAVYTGAGFAALWRRATEEAFARGEQAYAADTQLVMSPWRLPLATLPCPVRVWFGAEDVGHSPDLGAGLTQRLGATRSLVDDAGGALLWTHGELVLDGLRGGW